MRLTHLTFFLLVWMLAGCQLAGDLTGNYGSLCEPDNISASLAQSSGGEGTNIPLQISINKECKSQDLQISWKVEIGSGTSTPGVDLVLATGSSTIPSGESSTVILIPTLDDALDEDDETFEVTITNIDFGQYSTQPITVTIVDDDPLPDASVSDVSVQPGQIAKVTVSLDTISGRDLSFDWSTANGTALAALNYTTASGSVTIPAGSLSAELSVPTHFVNFSDPDKSFTITLTNPTNVNLLDGVGDVSIVVPAAGTKDFTFSDDGYFELPKMSGPSGTDRGLTGAVQEDGKILIGGITQARGFIARLNTDGSFDSTFGGGDGWFKTTDFAGGYERVYDLLIAPNGKIYYAIHWASAGNKFILGRLDADGTHDTSFDPAGFIVYDYPGTTVERIRSIFLLPDGKILGIGTAEGATDDVLIVKWDADGVIDTSFGTSGWVQMDINGEDDIGDHVSIQSDGKIIVGGRADNAGSRELFAARLNANGSLDTSFASSGYFKPGYASHDTGNEGVATHLLVNYSDHIFVASHGAGCGLFKLLPGGGLDTSFNTTGQAPSVPSGDNCSAMTLDKSQRLYVHVQQNSGANGAILRLLANGTWDPSFNGGAYVPISNAYVWLAGDMDLLITPQGNLVTVGGNYYPKINKIWTDTTGVPDVGFANAGASEGATINAKLTSTHRVTWPITINYNTQDAGTGSDATAGVDYTAITPQSVILSAITGWSVPLVTTPDAITEANEVFEMSYSSSNTEIILGTTSTHTIIDDD